MEDEVTKEDLAKWAHFWGMNSRSTLPAEEWPLFRKLQTWYKELPDEKNQQIIDYIQTVTRNL